MCGIFFVHGSPQPSECITASMSIQPRGPDHTSMMFDKDTFMTFQRLAINDLSDAGNQPMFHNNTYLLCNGEIYNCKDLNEIHQLPVTSSSDCESILCLYEKFTNSLSSTSVDALANMAYQLTYLLDGEFAFVIYDKNRDLIIAARDPHGVRPLFYYYDQSKQQIGFSSELKALHTLSSAPEQFQPGTVMVYHTKTKQFTWQKYNDFPIHVPASPSTPSTPSDEAFLLSQIHDTFTKAVTKRLMSERPVCALLSGGLDSSLVASIVARHIAPQKLNTYCIGFDGSPDLHYANLVAKHINSNHHVVQVKEQDFLDAIEETIKIIESYDITSVRASVGNLLVSKYIASTSQCKVVFNGDYSDEVCGGYRYLKKAPTPQAFHDECSQLVQNICYFDSLRSDRTISSQGLEARVPFSDKAFLTMYMSIDPSLRMSNTRIEKYLLRKAFENDNLLPHEVLFRQKEAFSDGVSKPERSWHNVIKEYIDTKITDKEFECNKDLYTFNTPPSKEAYYYRKVFEQYYPNMAHVIPKFWLPAWSGDMKEPSARELKD